ncbi:hypothetical protein SUGI_0101100 [Cryptomeria japonica]|uniref:uncharacterized protein LOC131035395 n=1 Tax=Cryptomeria japonica TaxID=3369 RepID=UPI002408C67D|nr:uncharacterized protein LOC131035395 [Cryptomeria japonica]XP_057823078.2 uncharacterized protein LOC131035395 [Cryptomeria japonica]XP_057823079.2 uncharacterized protein LOC131035395 [Cryptomeria japonica]GLJ09066.1 hypothetical protein SUGI_0101100 [Cryptomeria japonica]
MSSESLVPSPPPPPPPPSMKKHWWLSNKKLAEKHLSHAQALLGNQESNEIYSALNLLDAALDLFPNWEKALELKARALLYLRRFKEVAIMLQEYIPSVRFREDIFSSESSPVSREKVKLLPRYVEDENCRANAFLKCFSVSKLKKKLLAGLSKRCEREEWRYLVLGQACCHLGLMEDALLLLQSGKRVASAAFRRESICRSDDSFCSENSATDAEVVSHLLGNIKLLLRRKVAAMAALDAGLYLESARHFSKILDGRRGTPQGFIAECYMLRATAYQADGRVTDSIADCNRTLALDPTCMEALTTRASLFETVRCFPESLQDLEHLKLLHESILRHQKLPGPIWKHPNANFRDIHANLQHLNSKIHTMKQSLSSSYTIDYYTLIGLRRGCSRTDVERAHLLLCLRHRPDKASHFVERCEFVDERDIDAVKDQARASALMLYRLLQKAYTYIMTSIMEEEAEKQKQLRAIEAKKEEHNVHVKRVPEKYVKITNVSFIDTRASLKQSSSLKENEAKQSAIDPSDPKRKDVDSDLQQVILETKSTSNDTLTASTSSLTCNIQSEAPKVSDASPFNIYSSVQDDSNMQELADSSVFQAVSCRDLAAVGTILSHSFHSDTWMTGHQGHTLRSLPVNYEALSCS